MKLTEGQLVAVDKLGHFFVSKKDRFFLLKGSAGCGKTFTASKIPELSGNSESAIGTAPTHKAVKVLSGRLPDIDCMTIHRFLGLKPKKKGDKQMLVRKGNYDPSEHYLVKVVIVDEASMIDSQMLKFIEEDAETWDRQYVFLGDQYQLPPVSEEDSPCFTMNLPDHCVAELTEIMRHAGPIVITATTIRDAIIAGKQPDIKSGLMEDGTGVRLLKSADWEATLKRCVAHPEFLKDPDFCRVLAYRNERVMQHNQLVRATLNEPINVPFCPGDRLVANSAWTQSEEVLFPTGTEVTIKSMEPHTHPDYPELKGWQLWLEDFETVSVYVLDILNCLNAYKKRVATLVEAAKQPGGNWQKYYALSEYYADLRPLYAITVHNSQGSTFQNVFVDWKDIYVNRNKAEADRCLYVAVTRASKNVFVKI